jgi:hypothetical protein
MADTDNIKALQDLLGFNPSANPNPTADILKEVMQEIGEERAKKAKEQARKTLHDAIALHEQFVVADRQYQAQKAKFNKELGKLIGSLKRTLGGQPTDEPPADEPPQAG